MASASSCVKCVSCVRCMRCSLEYRSRNQRVKKKSNNPWLCDGQSSRKSFVQLITWRAEKPVPSLVKWKDRKAVSYVISTGRETRFRAFPFSLSNAKFLKPNSQWWVWKFPLVVKFGKLPSVVPLAAQTWLWLGFFGEGLLKGIFPPVFTPRARFNSKLTFAAS